MQSLNAEKGAITKWHGTGISRKELSGMEQAFPEKNYTLTWLAKKYISNKDLGFSLVKICVFTDTNRIKIVPNKQCLGAVETCLPAASTGMNWDNFNKFIKHGRQRINNKNALCKAF
jgi:hypothetical protein